MYIFGQEWQDGYLDYALSAGEGRIAVKAWWVLEELADCYNPQPRSLRRVWNYIKEVGLRHVIRKVIARLKESLRDVRFISVGVGEVLEVGQGSRLQKGAQVVFIAPSHPKCLERVVLPGQFVCDAPAQVYDRLVREGGIALFENVAPRTRFDWDRVAGWSKYSGLNVSDVVGKFLEWAKIELGQLDPSAAALLPLPEPSPVKDRSGPLDMDKRPGQLTAGISGLGNITKTITLGNLPRSIRVACIHEIDPVQIGRVVGGKMVFDTTDSWREDEKYDIYFIAGYHHTHPDLAIFALEHGGWAIVEKPLLTKREQLRRLLPVLQKHPGRMFVGFHMRYSPLYALARKDLGVRPGEPIHMHSIVYEIPIARRHWYNWPNAGSRIISNGCHWTDLFLFLNDFAKPVRKDVWKANNHDVHVSLELENGAVFGLALTEQGSWRIGVQEHTELRANGVAVKVDNGARYFAEDVDKVIRTKRVNKLDVLTSMQKTMFQKILNGEPGDSIESVQRSCELMLDLEDMLQSL